MLDCSQVRELSSEMLDGRVVHSDRRDILMHMELCADCSYHLRQIREIRESMRSAERPKVPSEIQLGLLVTASREAARRRRFNGITGPLKAWRSAFALWANNLMRPIAVPAMGGLASAVILFSMVMTNFQGIVRAHPQDVPTALFTGASYKSSLDLVLGAEEIAIDVYVDERGRVIDYAFPTGYGRYNTPVIRRGLETSLLFTQFNPATTFGRPVSGWVRVSFRRSEVQVKG